MVSPSRLLAVICRKEKDIQDLSKQEGIGVKFEYTTSSTLQQNSLVQWKFAMLFNFVWVIMAVNFPVS